MTNLQVEPVIFETQALFDLDITLQASGYEVNNHYAKGAAIAFSFIWAGISVMCTGLSYVIIKDQWENL